MTDKIDSLIAEIERELPIEEGQVRIEVYGGGLDECIIRANKSGYLKLGLAFIKAAIAPHQKEGEETVDVDISDLFIPESEVCIDLLERTENVDRPSPVTQSTRDLAKRESRFGCLFMASIFIVVVLILAYIIFVKGP